MKDCSVCGCAKDAGTGLCVMQSQPWHERMTTYANSLPSYTGPKTAAEREKFLDDIFGRAPRSVNGEGPQTYELPPPPPVLPKRRKFSVAIPVDGVTERCPSEISWDQADQLFKRLVKVAQRRLREVPICPDCQQVVQFTFDRIGTENPREMLAQLVLYCPNCNEEGR